MKFIVGLGNPGGKYFKTRHNAGFLVLDEVLSQAGESWQGKKFDAEIARHSLFGADCLCLKPQTFMNLSGRSLFKALQFYKATLADVVVLHDDIDLVFGQVKTRLGGGHGGHNGIRSILAEAGADNFARIKLGVGRPQPGESDVSDWVLAEFSAQELMHVRSAMVTETITRLRGWLQNSV